MAEDIPKPAASPEPIPKLVSPLDIDSIDAYVAHVLEITPDVQPAHLHTLLTQHLRTYKDGAIEMALHALFEDSHYPKIDEGERKQEEIGNGGDERGLVKTKTDYGYADIALVRSTPIVPKDIQIY